jgi:uncharacterized cupredoxin-like copper-binding protein
VKRQSHRFTAAIAALVIAGAAAAAGEHGHGGHEGHGVEENVLGEPGKAAEVSRSITVEMADTMRFTPEMIDVEQGETIRFVVKNAGRLRHEMVLGTPQELKQHYAMMLKMPEMEHDEDNMVSVEPGKTGEIIWHFTRARVVDFACLQAGHYGAGMKGQVRVTRASLAPAPPPASGAHGAHQH